MLISRQWIESMLEAPDASSPVLDDIGFGDAMTSLGLEVEGIERVGGPVAAIMVGRVESIAPHPKADKLRLVAVFDGARTVPVVCGAANVPPPGGNIAFAPVGATMPDGLEIAAREIRGERSEGMICSESELGIGPDDDGILVLPEAWEAGARLVDLVPGIEDAVYEVGITPNRPDALGHVGVALDLAVKLRRRCTVEFPQLPDTSALPDLVELQAGERCGRYFGRAFEQANVAASPLWLRVRLHRLGLRPINNVVDITNLVLMQWGQPLHVFDRAKLQEGRVVVRLAKPAEPMTTLDDQKLELTDDDLVIADAVRPQALAGVMGGIDSGVEPGAETLLLEAAWFQPPAVRRSARRHGLNTDSSYRFERGVDFGRHLEAAAATAAALLESLAGARCIGGHEARGQTPAPPKITLRAARTTQLLGMSVPVDEARRVLAGLSIEVDESNPEAWSCVPPTYRPDLQIEEDLIEELVRHYGLDRLPATPALPSEPPGMRVTEAQRALQRRQAFEHDLVDGLRASGYSEHLAFAFTDPVQLEPFESAVPLSQAVRVANPLRVQTSVMRTHMMPGLLNALATNVARHARPVRLFEVGRVYDWSPEKDAASGPTAKVDAQLPRERTRAAVLLFDRADGSASGLVGAVLDALGRVGIRAAARVAANPGARPWLHPGIQADLVAPVGGVLTPVGEVGEVHPDLLARWELQSAGRVFYAELRFESIALPEVRQYRALPRFPATSRDLSLEIPLELSASAVVDALVQAEAELEAPGEDPPRLGVGDTSAHRVDIVEDYRGQGVVPGHRALLLRLHYRATARSVTDSEVQARHAEVVERACEQLRSAAPSIRAR